MKKYYISAGILFLGAPILFGSGAFLAEKTGHADSSSASKTIVVKNGESAEAKVENQISLLDQQEDAEKEPDQKTEGTEVLGMQEKKEEAPLASEKLTFAIIGDSQYFKPGDPNGGLQQAVKNISSKNVDFTIAVGDLVSSCDGKAECDKNLSEWKSIMGSLFPKTYAVMGNHDRTGGEKADAKWQNFFTLPLNGPVGYSETVYSFDTKNSHFVVLNSEKPEEHLINDIQRSWLELDLSKNTKENTFVFFHEPAYPLNSKVTESLDAFPKDRDALWNMLVNKKVAAVFCGHEHINSRKQEKGLRQFTFGNTDSFNHDPPKVGAAEYSFIGKAFGIVEVEGKKITVSTFSVDGKLLDKYEFSLT